MKRETLFAEIITQVGSGHEEEYADFAREIKQREEMQLIPEYQELLNNIKDNPIEEPKLAQLMKDAQDAKISQFDIAANVLGEKFNDAEDIEQVALLIKKTSEKVLGFRDEKGIVKKTKNFEEYEPMKPIDRMKYENLTIKAEKDPSQEKEINEFLKAKTKVDMATLSTWEQGLFKEILAQEAKGISNIFLGKK